ncbi:MAG: trigger factor [Myxococcales bacterium]
MTKVSVEEVSPIERRIKVEVEPEKVDQQLDLAYRMISHRVRIPGFRPGKVPRRILESRFKDQVEGDVIQRVVEDSYREAVIQHQIVPVSAPRVTNDGLKKGEPFRFQAQVEVKPKVEPKDYEGLELKKPKVQITDEQVDAEIERMRQSLAELEPVEGRAAQLGDFAIVDYEGTIEGKPFPGSKREGATVEIAAGELVDGNIAAIEGMNVGDEKTLEYAFPKDYRMEEVAGKVATFKLQLKALKSKRVPPLDDELAKDVGAGQTLQELKDRVRKELTDRETEKVEKEFRDQLLSKLVEKNPFEVPKAMVERAIDMMLEGALERFTRQGIDVSRMGLDFDRLREDLRERAVMEVKGALLLEAISEKEKVEATDDDVEKRMKEISERVNTPLEKVRSYLSGEERKTLVSRLREEKTIEFLTSKAKISEA